MRTLRGLYAYVSLKVKEEVAAQHQPVNNFLRSNISPANTEPNSDTVLGSGIAALAATPVSGKSVKMPSTPKRK